MLEAGEFEEESFLEGGRGGRGGREGGRGEGREGGIHAVRTLAVIFMYLVSLQVAQSLSYSLLHGNHLTAQSAVILEERYREGRMFILQKRERWGGIERGGKG